MNTYKAECRKLPELLQQLGVQPDKLQHFEQGNA